VSVATASCGCCSGVTERTPLEVANRPGLSAVAYRVGAHSDFLASMIAGLADADHPRLANLGTRDRDDFSIALLDAWAVAADVLSFYTERLAQESYLRTARERISLQELGRLIGYHLRPGVAAETHLAFALEPPPEVPPGASKDPGSQPPFTPASVMLEKALRVQSVPGPGEKAQTFETVEEVEARPEWNAIPATTTLFATGLGTNHAYLQRSDLNLKPGDGFAIVPAGGAASTWEFRILTDVEPNPELNRTFVKWSVALQSLAPYLPPNAPPGACAFRKRLSVFGHNAPRRDLIDTSMTGDWEDFDISPPDGNYVDLEGSHPDVVDESYVVLTMPGGVARVWQVVQATERSRARWGVSGKVTRLNLIGGMGYSDYETAVRQTTIFAVSDLLALAAAPDDSLVGGSDSIDVNLDVSDMRPGRRLVIRGKSSGEDVAEAAVLKIVDKVPGAWRITLESDLTQTFVRKTVVVHGNVALATHGETVEQLLGSGRASVPFQRFSLAHEPLTYIQSTDATSGATDALEVRVNDVRWDEVPTLYGGRPSDRGYVLRTDEEGKAYVQFGDGECGARLPTGSNNVRARYRKGLGAAGNVKAGTLAQLFDRPLGVKGVGNPLDASGGVDPESEDAARASIPLGVRTLGRTVSLLDYEDYARTFTGVVKANAVVLPLHGVRTVVITVAFEGGERIVDLTDALRKHGDPLVQVLVVEAATEAFRLAMNVAVDPTYEEDAVLAAVEAGLRSAYSFDARALLEPVFRSEIVAAAHAVDGVLAADIDYLYTGTTADLADRLLAQRPDIDPTGNAIPAGVLVLDPGPLDSLAVMSP
jgi:Baseplate J-like protein